MRDQLWQKVRSWVLSACKSGTLGHTRSMPDASPRPYPDVVAAALAVPVGVVRLDPVLRIVQQARSVHDARLTCTIGKHESLLPDKMGVCSPPGTDQGTSTRRTLLRCPTNNHV